MQHLETEWLRKAKQGDDEAFSKLVETYKKPVYNLCYRMLGEKMAAEDAAQETFWRAYKNIKRYDENRSFPTWLLSIASHHCIDQHRKKKAITVGIEDLPFRVLSDPKPGVEAAAVSREQREQIQTLLQSLGPKDRSTVVLRYWYDYSYEEIAEALSLTVSAVKSRLHRSRRELAGLWLHQQPQLVPVERTRHETPAI